MNFFVRWGALAPALVLVAAGVVSAAEISSIDFKLDSGKTVLEITGDAPLELSQSENAADNQVVLDLKGAKLSAAASRKLDTSSFDSPVKLVSPYRVGDDSRVVIQLSQMTSPTVTTEGNVVRVEFPGGGQAEAAQAGSGSPDADAVPGAAGETGANAAAAAGPESFKDEGTLAAYEKSIVGGNFKGKPVTINVRDAEVRDVLRLIGEASGFNLVVSAEVDGKISLQLEDVPWDQVLNVVLKTMQLGAERNGNVLRVLPVANLTRERQGELQARQAAQASAPRVTRVFPLSYSSPEQMIPILQSFGSGTGPISEASGGLAGAGLVISSDTRTNSLVVQALAEDLERVQKLIEILDTETPQVLIEAKIVEASETFSKDISGNLGVGGGRFGASFNGGDNLTDGLLGTTSLSGASTGGGAIGVSPSISFLPGIQRVNATLNLAETEAIAKVISSPRIVVLNNQDANINQQIPILRQQVTFSEGGTPIQTPVQVNANLTLGVRPQVTNDEKVVMQLNVVRDTILDSEGDALIAGRNLTTRVLVDSGSTLVIAGLYTFDHSDRTSGIPLLKDIPILGVLFGSTGAINNRTELFVFISPRIINASSAGLEG